MSSSPASLGWESNVQSGLGPGLTFYGYSLCLIFFLQCPQLFCPGHSSPSLSFSGAMLVG